MPKKEKDVATVGVSAKGDAMLKEIVAQTEWFTREIDVYRAGIAVALGQGLEPIPYTDTTTKFNVGTLETSTSQIASLIRALAPAHQDRPYAHSQELAEAGILHLYQQLVDQSVSIHKALLG